LGNQRLEISLIEAHIKLIEQEEKHQGQMEQYKDKAERFDAIVKALAI
jgi:hypothetical protein